MINVDTIYQRVLVLANKEQRGYITPQEFNIYANMAQLHIFEQYFFDLNQFARMPVNGMEYSDSLDLLNEKISLFKGANNIPLVFSSSQGHTLPPNLYRLGTVECQDPVSNQWNEATQVNTDRLSLLIKSPLTAPTLTRPIYIQRGRRIRIYTEDSEILNAVNTRCSFITQPLNVTWGYVVVKEKALYDPLASANFQLHASDASELVYTILSYAGISIKSPDLSQLGAGLAAGKSAQEKL